MSYALVSHVAKANATSGSTTAIDTTGANLLIANVADYSGQSAAVLSDSKGNTWTALTARTQGSVRQTTYYAQNPTVGAGHTFSIDATNSFVDLNVAAFSGAATASVLDQQSGAVAGTAAGTIQPGSLTPSVDNCLVVVGLGSTRAATGSTIDSGTLTDDVANANFEAALWYVIQTTATAVNPTVTQGFGSDSAVSMGVFKPPGGGGGPQDTPELYGRIPGGLSASRQAHQLLAQ